MLGMGGKQGVSSEELGGDEGVMSSKVDLCFLGWDAGVYLRRNFLFRKVDRPDPSIRMRVLTNFYNDAGASHLLG